jgi:hypothetical protein
MVNFRLDGQHRPFLMQFDTGCDADLIYGAIPRVAANQFLLSGSAAGSRFERERFYVQHFAGIRVYLAFLIAFAWPLSAGRFS